MKIVYFFEHKRGIYFKQEDAKASNPMRNDNRRKNRMITDKKSPYRLVTVEELAKLREREDKLFNERTPKSREAFDKAHENLLDGVPMPWMADWGTDHPVFLEKAKDQKCWDIDGNEYIDFCLGDTGAMFGHSPDATAKTIAEKAYCGITTMMPTLDSLEIGKELSKRFGLPTWQVAMTATGLFFSKATDCSFANTAFFLKNSLYLR